MPGGRALLCIDHMAQNPMIRIKPANLGYGGNDDNSLKVLGKILALYNAINSINEDSAIIRLIPIILFQNNIPPSYFKEKAINFYVYDSKSNDNLNLFSLLIGHIVSIEQLDCSNKSIELIKRITFSHDLVQVLFYILDKTVINQCFIDPLIFIEESLKNDYEMKSIYLEYVKDYIESKPANIHNL